MKIVRLYLIVLAFLGLMHEVSYSSNSNPRKRSEMMGYPLEEQNVLVYEQNTPTAAPGGPIIEPEPFKCPDCPQRPCPRIEESIARLSKKEESKLLLLLIKKALKEMEEREAAEAAGQKQ